MADKIPGIETAVKERQTAEGAYGEKKSRASLLKTLLQEGSVLKKAVVLEALMNPLWREDR